MDPAATVASDAGRIAATGSPRQPVLNSTVSTDWTADGITIGPVLLGCTRPAHILTPSATVRRIVNMTALTVVEANAQRTLFSA